MFRVLDRTNDRGVLGAFEKVLGTAHADGPGPAEALSSSRSAPAAGA